MISHIYTQEFIDKINDYIKIYNLKNLQIHFENDEIKSIYSNQNGHNYDIDSDDIEFFTIYKSFFSNLMINAGYNINPNIGVLECWSYNPNNNNVNSLDRHTDDYGNVNYPVETCILYTKKDETIIGGNFFYYKNNIEHKIYIKSGTLLMMKGNLEHSPESITGVGQRNCLVCFFKSNEKR